MKKSRHILFFITLAVFCIIGSDSAFAAVSKVQCASGYPLTSVNFGSNVTAGNLLVAFFQEGFNAGTQQPDPVVTDTLGNTWTLVSPNTWLINGTGFHIHQWAYYTVSGSSGADTVDYSGTSGSRHDPGVYVVELTGQDSVTPISATSSGSAGSGSYWSAQTPFSVPAGGMTVSMIGDEDISGDTITYHGNQTVCNSNGGQFGASFYEPFASASSTELTYVYSNLSTQWALTSLVINPQAVIPPPPSTRPPRFTIKGFMKVMRSFMVK